MAGIASVSLNKTTQVVLNVSKNMLAFQTDNRLALKLTLEEALKLHAYLTENFGKLCEAVQIQNQE